MTNRNLKHKHEYKRAGIGLAAIVVVAIVISNRLLAQAPDIRTVQPDLETPKMETGEPAAGRRVRQVHPDYAKTKAYHALYLPANWKADSKRRLPVIVELAGNGPYKSPHGDISTGHVEGSCLGYGLSAGRDYIWLCLPYLNGDGTENVRQWWGSKPKHNPMPTVEYCLKTVPWVCKKYGGDPKRVVLVGFSRGAIACNYIGLRDDRIARLWCGFVAYSHYDGVHEGWSYPGADRKSAKVRLNRLGNRPQFICHEDSGGGLSLKATRKYLKEAKPDGNFTFQSTGFRNHNDAWTLRPTAARNQLRGWLAEVTSASKQK